jgi:hypothetical protein
MSGEITFAREELHQIVCEGVNRNERDLMGCAGHRFVALNPYLSNSNYRCTRCGGVVDSVTAMSAR